MAKAPLSQGQGGMEYQKAIHSICRPAMFDNADDARVRVPAASCSRANQTVAKALVNARRLERVSETRITMTRLYVVPLGINREFSRLSPIVW